VEQVKCEYDQNKQCATISQHVDISIVNEMNFTHEYLMTMQITHKHKLYLVSLVTSLRVQCVPYMEYLLGHEGILCDTDMSIRPFYVSEVGG
jgi:hypothetical protein